MQVIENFAGRKSVRKFQRKHTPFVYRNPKDYKQISKEIFVDNFAGGGGASTGIEVAIGRSVDEAINHDPASIALHEVNHPETRHWCESVWDVDPRTVAAGRPVALAWFSPDCKHFSKAKGGKPVDKSIRGLAWVAVRWAATVRPRVIMLENVEEFQTWGPLKQGEDGNWYPDPTQKGRTFKSFVNALRRLGYEVEWRELRACDYGAPTIRKRLFLIARCDGQAIVWPGPTHGDPESPEVKVGRLLPWHPAADIIDWSIPCKSIFGRIKPLAEKTMRRIGLGTWKWVIDTDKPYIAPVGCESDDNSDLVAAFLTQYHSYEGSDVRGQSLDRPLLTLDTSNRYGLVTAHLMKMKGTNIGQSVDKPIQTVTAGGLHYGVVQCFLIAYYGSSIGQPLDQPLGTIPTHDRFGLVMVHGTPYKIIDIRMRMLKPRELFRGQGFPNDYIIERDRRGKPYPITEQVARCGNSVAPPLPAAMVRVNLPEHCAGSGNVLKFERYAEAEGQLQLSM